jgi:hypothetical protein
MSDLNQNTESEKAKGNPPTHIAKVRHGSGEGATYEQIGAAWMNEKGAIYIKLHGTQLVSGFSLYAAPEKHSA